MKLLAYILLSQNILLIYPLINSGGWQQPKNLSQIRVLYKSGRMPGREKPIIVYSKVYFLHNGCTKVYNLDTREVSIIPPKLYRKPLLYTNTIFSFYSLFLTKDCRIHIYEEDGIRTFENYNHLAEIKFNNLGSCYDTLRIYYEHSTRYAAIYNFQENGNIFVLDLEKTKQSVNDEVIIINNDYRIYQSLIYSNNDGEKSVLIVSDTQGIKFYNLKGYASSFWINDPGKLVKSSNLGHDGFIDFIDGNKVIWSLSNFFRVFELESFNEVRRKNYFLPGFNLTKSLIGLKDGRILVGSNFGYIFLIEYKYGDLYIIDSRKLCDSEIDSISYTDNCYEGTIFCYTFAANCRKIIVFQIGISDDKEISDSIQEILIFLFILLILIICCCKKYKE